MSELIWTWMRRDRARLPDSVRGDYEAVESAILEAATRAYSGHWYVDRLADQIDVYRNGRLVAVYMP